MRIQKMERAALRLLQKQEAERVMRKQFREAEEKRKLKEAQKRKEDAEILRQLLNAAGRSRPTTPISPKFRNEQEEDDHKKWVPRNHDTTPMNSTTLRTN